MVFYQFLVLKKETWITYTELATLSTIPYFLTRMNVSFREFFVWMFPSESSSLSFRQSWQRRRSVWLIPMFVLVEIKEKQNLVDVRSFVRLFVCLFVRLFVCLFVCSFVRLFVCWPLWLLHIEYQQRAMTDNLFLKTK